MLSMMCLLLQMNLLFPLSLLVLLFNCKSWSCPLSSSSWIWAPLCRLLCLCSTVLHDPAQSFAGGLLHNPLVEGEYQQQGAGGGELVEGTQNIAYAFPPCLAGLQREEVEGTHEQGEQQDAWDKVQWEVDDGVEEVDEGGS
ncbi:hypothetical protein EDD16DRAFT_1517267 [Pisolithus croceorrhizus]|nr:hypothetical protein EDD16DRAFT_1517267 [Pisolithus croceorrhizus]